MEVEFQSLIPYFGRFYRLLSPYQRVIMKLATNVTELTFLLFCAKNFVHIFIILPFIYAFHLLYLVYPLFPIVALVLLRTFNLNYYYYQYEYCLLAISVYFLVQRLNRLFMEKFRWFRRECRLLGAACNDIIEALQYGNIMQLTEEEEQWVTRTKKLVDKAEPFISAFHARAQNFLTCQLLFLHFFKVRPIWKDISGQREQSPFGIYRKLEKARCKSRSLQQEGMLVKGESKSNSLADLLVNVNSILYAIRSTNAMVETKLELKFVLLEAFLEDMEHAKFPSAMEKAWLAEMKAYLDDVCNNSGANIIRRIDAAFNSALFFPIIHLLALIEVSVLLTVNMNWMGDLLVKLMKAENEVSFKFIRIYQETPPYQNKKDVMGEIRGHLNQLTFVGNGECVSLCNRLKKLVTQAEAIEGKSNFLTQCLQPIRNTLSQLERAHEKYTRRSNANLETSSIESQIKDLELFVAAYDSRGRPESSTIIGLKEDTDELVRKLTTGSEQCCVFSIVGMQGIGKTTLANEVYQHQEILRHFPHRIWVSMPQGSVNPFEHLANQIVRSNESREIEKGREREYYFQRIQSSLDEDRYLVVLDNVSTIVWDTINDVFPENRKGSRILVTTRDMTLASRVDQSEQPQKIRLRTKEESWKLFLEKVQFPSELLSQDEMVVRKAKYLVRSCWGLPLSLSRLGVLMAGEVVDSSLLSTASTEVSQYQALWSEILQNSGLTDMRSLLSCINLFPKDSEIPPRRLIALWVAEGLVKAKDDGEKTLESIAEDHLFELIDLNIIQPVKKNVNGKVKMVCLPNPLRDVLSSISTSCDQQRLADHNDPSDALFELIHGADCDTNRPDVRGKCKNLVAFISFDTREGDKPGNDVDKFLRMGILNGCFKKLKVLDLERVFRPRLPRTIEELVELRYLGLRWTYLEEIPSTIGNLSKLQTLDMKHTYLCTLPTTIWKLQELRHLYLNQTYRTKFVRQSKTGGLHNLQTLWGAFLDKNSPLTKHLHELKSLRKLQLAFHLSKEQQKELAKGIANLQHLQSLRLRSVGVMSEPQDLHLADFSELRNLSDLYLYGKLEINELLSANFPDSLSDITLSASGLQDDPMPILEKLPNLKSLCLYSNSFTGERMVCSARGFPKLLVLKMWNLPCLVTWIIKEEAMQNLVELDIRSCRRLKGPHGMFHLKSLRDVKSTKMPWQFRTEIYAMRILTPPEYSLFMALCLASTEDQENQV